MDEIRHAHPHVDPRQPRDGTNPGTNPPVFAWKPVREIDIFKLEIARDGDFNDVVFEIPDLEDPVYLPEKAFDVGAYFWRWSDGVFTSPVFQFKITEASVVLEVPLADVWLQRFPAGHPRIYLSPNDVEAFREKCSEDERPMFRRFEASADSELADDHHMDEPDFLGDRATNYAEFWKIWYPTMWGSRRFIKGAETLGLAWLATGNEEYARAACKRLVSISKWDPKGSSYLGHNDEAHMSVIWHGANACDFVWDQFTEEERALVIEQYRQRGEITYEHMHDLGLYGITRFDSHAGREIVFLAHIALVFHEHIPEAKKWLNWLRPVLCGLWPSWAGDDGGWAQGPSYGLAYVTIMTMFCSALKRGAGIDLYQRPFWGNHARWRQWIVPPYIEWLGFGDHSERWSDSWLNGADLVALIGHETGTSEFDAYVAELREEARLMDTPDERKMPGVCTQLFTAPEGDAASERVSDGHMLRVFPAVGWAAIRADVKDRERDIAMVFRSSPFGSVSHSHANNNDFILHVGGRVMAMPSGYYSGYASDHHAHWVWHTKSHNCVTLSDAPQLMRSHDSLGAVENAFEDERLTYFRGTADKSYADRADRCRRHVIFVKEQQYFVMVDEFVAKPGIASGLQWNLHSWNEYEVNEERRLFQVRRGDSVLLGHFMHHKNGFFSLSEGWDPPPMKGKDHAQWHQQYHLRFTPSGIEIPARNLGVILSMSHEHLDAPIVETELVGETEVAHIGNDLVMVNQGAKMAYENYQSDALILLSIGGQRYGVRDSGISNG
jgi:hypothetical protein